MSGADGSLQDLGHPPHEEGGYQRGEEIARRQHQEVAGGDGLQRFRVGGGGRVEEDAADGDGGVVAGPSMCVSPRSTRPLASSAHRCTLSQETGSTRPRTLSRRCRARTAAGSEP